MSFSQKREITTNDMRRTFAMLAGVATLLGTAFASTTSGAQAATATGSTSYTTVMTQTLPVPSAGIFPGKLSLEVSSDGIVSGSYSSDYEGSTVSVAGGVQGDQLWLDLGEFGAVQIVATMQKDGTIVGTASGLHAESLLPLDSPARYSFVATPQKSD
jgi:hypothetical protein